MLLTLLKLVKMKILSYAIAAVLCGASLGVTSSAVAHDLTYSPELAQRSFVNMPTLTANMDTVPYSHLLYGFQLYIDVDGANFNTSDVNRIRNATTLSIPNRVTPYKVTDNNVRYRISGEPELRAINSITLTVDQSVLSVPHSLSITLPVFHDIAPPDTPHEDANTKASLTVNSVNATDFLDGSGTVFTIRLKDGEFPIGCSDIIAHSIMETSNVPGIVRIWSKTQNQVEFIVEGGIYEPISGNWNFELGLGTTTLNEVLHISAPINH